MGEAVLVVPVTELRPTRAPEGLLDLATHIIETGDQSPHQTADRIITTILA